jgi:hypothetical protein
MSSFWGIVRTLPFLVSLAVSLFLLRYSFLDADLPVADALMLRHGTVGLGFLQALCSVMTVVLSL